jgi:hypothetical protein
MIVSLKTQVFNWLDAHGLSLDEADDFDYVESLIYNFEEYPGEELEEEEVIECILDYQAYRRNK